MSGFLSNTVMSQRTKADNNFVNALDNQFDHEDKSEHITEDTNEDMDFSLREKKRLLLEQRNE